MSPGPGSSPPPRRWIKICANTTLDDALMAAGLGADAVGFVFAPSPRQVTPAQVASITPHLPAHVERVGVFAGHTPADLERIVSASQQSGLTAIQLHGAAPLAFAHTLQQRLGQDISIIQTAHWAVGNEEENAASGERIAGTLAELAAQPEPFRILVDTRLGSASGGLGIPFDWSRARTVLTAHLSLRVIVAGGLRPDNVAQAIAALNPWGVDVASGVEQAPGRKDQAKLKAFLQAARQAL